MQRPDTTVEKKITAWRKAHNTQSSTTKKNRTVLFKYDGKNVGQAP